MDEKILKAVDKPEGEAVNVDLEIQDLNSIVAPQSYDIEAKTVYLQFAVGKPKKHEFFQVRDGNEWTMGPVGIYKEQHEYGSDTYVIMPEMYESMEGLIAFHRLVLAVTRQDKPYVWPVRLPDQGGRDNPWHVTAREAVERAKRDWIRLIPNQLVGAYEMKVAESQLYKPAWPDISFLEIVNKAFKGRFIRDEDHAIVKKIRGLV